MSNSNIDQNFLRKALGYLLAFALAYIAAKWGIVPYPQEPGGGEPKVIILQPPGGMEVKLVQ